MQKEKEKEKETEKAQFGLFVLGAKGLHVLESLVAQFSGEVIGYVVVGDDKKVAGDSAEQIRQISKQHGIRLFERSELDCLQKNCAQKNSAQKNSAQKNDLHQATQLPKVTYKFAIGWRWLIKSTTGLIVYHDSLLPKYRGFAPLVNALVNGEREIGVTALIASEGYDEGDIIGQQRLQVDYPVTIAEAIEQISPLYAKLAVQIVEATLAGRPLQAKAQQHSEATYSLWLDDEDYRIDWRWSAEKIARFVDAVGEPYAGAQTTRRGALLKIFKAKVADDVQIEHRERHIGKIIFFTGGVPTVVCGEGLIELHDIRDANGEPGDLTFGNLTFRTRFG